MSHHAPHFRLFEHTIGQSLLRIKYNSGTDRGCLAAVCCNALVSRARRSLVPRVCDPGFEPRVNQNAVGLNAKSSHLIRPRILLLNSSSHSHNNKCRHWSRRGRNEWRLVLFPDLQAPACPRPSALNPPFLNFMEQLAQMVTSSTCTLWPRRTRTE